MIANYHTHTYRCHHATGCEWQYANAAVAGGLKILGFADHTPMPFPPELHYERTKVRMRPEELRGYVEAVNVVRRLYAGKLEIHCGLEAEYYPVTFPLLMELLERTPGVEYLIMGQHFIKNEYDCPSHAFKPCNDPAMLTLYVNQVLEGLQTGKFLYLAHPDVFNFIGDPAHYTQEMRRLCRGVNALGLPLEINGTGYRGGRHYPAPRFWEIAAEENCAVVLGTDAHAPANTCDAPCVEGLEAFARRYGFNVSEQLEIKEMHWV